MVVVIYRTVEKRWRIGFSKVLKRLGQGQGAYRSRLTRTKTTEDTAVDVTCFTFVCPLIGPQQVDENHLRVLPTGSVRNISFVVVVVWLQ